MRKDNPIIIIDDDEDDLQLVCEAFKEVGVESELMCFKAADEALRFLQKTLEQPLIILCDVNMNTTNGFELRKILHSDASLRIKSIPFLFLSTSDRRQDVSEAYNLSVQGYFKKPNSFDGMVSMLRCILEYWTYCQHPNTKD
jgi:DNA-binding NarL/FixJ family response regulator